MHAPTDHCDWCVDSGAAKINRLFFSLQAHGPKRLGPGSRVGEGYRSKGSFSELHIRTAAGSDMEARHYIALGFPVDATDSGCDGWGVLHYAAKFDRVDVLELFLNHGADPLQEDWNGVRPHQIAREKGNYAFLKRIQKAIEHVNNRTVPAESPLPGFQVSTNRSPAKLGGATASGGASPVPFGIGTPKYAAARAMSSGLVVDQDGDGVLDEEERREAGLLRGVLDQDGDGKVTTQEQEDFGELTEGLREWLGEMNLGYYFNSFTEVGIYTTEDLREANLCEDDLEDDMGIASDRERMKVLAALEKL